MIWPRPDLRSNFEIDLSMSKSTCFGSARRGEHDGIIYIFISLISKSCWRKTISVKTTTFHLMTSGAKTIDLRSNIIKSIARAWGELPNASFECFLAIIVTFGDNSDCLQKIVIFSKFDIWWAPVTLIFTWPENKLVKVWDLVAVFLMPLPLVAK